MSLKRTCLLVALALMVLPLPAGPGYRGLMTVLQPDGREIRVQMQGDEWGHVCTLEDGSAVVRAADGWFYYAHYGADGTLQRSSVRVGDPVPADLAADSRAIPHERLAREAAGRREAVGILREQERNRVRARTKADGQRIRHGLVILAQFPDLPFKAAHTKAVFQELIAGSGATSALSYFRDQWRGAYEFKFDISDIITLPHGYSYYGQNGADGQDIRPAQMVADACQAAASSLNFSLYDNDGDGRADNVFIIFAGPDEAQNAGEDYLWSHQWYLYSGAGINLVLNGKRIDNYACCSELNYDPDSRKWTQLCGIGTFCHEYTHTFGIPDLYDTVHPMDGTQAEGIWHFLALMDAGNQNNNGKTPPFYCAVERWYFGLDQPKELTLGPHTLRPIHENGDYYLIPTDDPDECYLLECRQQTGWDAYIGGSGLLIYHIDLSKRDAGDGMTAFEHWRQNKVNILPAHQCVDLVEPDPDARAVFVEARTGQALLSLIPHAVWPYGTHNLFTPVSQPAFRFWSGREAPVSITGITRNGDGSVSFTVVANTGEKAPSVQLDGLIVYQDGALIRWRIDRDDYFAPSYLRYADANGNDFREIEVLPYENGHYACMLEGLTPTTPYKVQLLCKAGGVDGPVNSNAAFTTKSAPKEGQFPYIYLKDLDRREDGSFAPGTGIPLHVYHAPDARGVEWFWNGKALSADLDGCFHPTTSGTLKAVVHLPDGSRDILVKEISVR